MTVTNRTRTGHTTALLLLVLALLVFAARGAGHGHEVQPLPGDSLCAICVYGGATLGGMASTQAPPVLPFWHLRPDAPGYRSVTGPVSASTRIRGPPVSV